MSERSMLLVTILTGVVSLNAYKPLSVSYQGKETLNVPTVLQN